MTVILASTPSTRFAAPDHLMATEPPEQRGLRRDGVRLLVAEGETIRHTRFARIGEHLARGTCSWSTPQPRFRASWTPSERVGQSWCT